MDEQDTRPPFEGLASAVSFEVVQKIVTLLQPLAPHERNHVLRTVATWLQIPSNEPVRVVGVAGPTAAIGAPVKSAAEYPFSGRAEATAKEFLLEKDPKTDTERMACLAYYLTHFRDTSQFKTEDVSKLNTEAAQRRFSNAALTAKNAMRDGFFVPASKKGHRQLSALGEQYVQALPDREAAKLVRRRMFTRRAKPGALRKPDDSVGEI